MIVKQMLVCGATRTLNVESRAPAQTNSLLSKSVPVCIDPVNRRTEIIISCGFDEFGHSLPIVEHCLSHERRIKPAIARPQQMFAQCMISLNHTVEKNI